MKKSIKLLSCIIILACLAGCKKQAALKDITLSFPEEKEGQSKQQSLVNKWENVLAAINLGFQNDYFDKYEVLKVIDKPDYIAVIPEKDRSFFDDYVGTYISKDSVEMQALGRFLYDLRKMELYWGIEFYFGKWPTSIRYNFENGVFQETNGGGSIDIDNISKYNLPEDWVRISGPSNGNDFLVSSIRLNRERIGLYSEELIISQTDRDDVYGLVLLFFNAMANADYTSILDICNKQDIEFEQLGRTVSLDSEDILAYIRNIKDSFEYSYIPNMKWVMLINEYYSEDPEYILSKYTKPILVELVAQSPGNYFSLIFEKINNGYKVKGVRNCLDQE